MNAKLKEKQNFKRITPIFLLILTSLFYLINVFQRTSWGQPLLLHADEHTVVYSAYIMAHDHTIFPSVFNRPDYLEIMINFLVCSVVSPIRFGIGYAAAFKENTFFFYQVGRCVTMSFGLGTVILAYFIGKKFHRNAGIPSAVIFAVFPLYMENAYYATPDIPLTFMVMITILFAIRYLEKPSYSNLICMCVFVAASVAIKYPGAIGVLLIAIVVIKKSIENKQYGEILKKGAIAAGATIASLFMIAPALFIRYQRVIRDITNESRTKHLGADGLGFLGNAEFYISVLCNNFGWLFLAFSIIGLICIIHHKNKFGITLLISPIYWIVMSAVPLHWERWSLPMMITPLLLTGIGFAYMLKRARSFKGNFPIAKYAVCILAIIMFISPALTDIADTASVLMPDTRQAGLIYCREKNITEGCTVNDGYTPFSPGKPINISAEVHAFNGKIIPLYRNTKQPCYVIVSSEMYNRYYSRPKVYAVFNVIYNTLKNDCQKIAEFDAKPRFTSMLSLTNIYDQMSFLTSINKTSYSGNTIIIYLINPKNLV